MDAEKIICCDRGNDNALAYAAMANRNNDPMAMAAMMNGGMNNWNNSPWMYLIFLALFGGGGFGFGNRGAGMVQGSDTVLALADCRQPQQQSCNAGYSREHGRYKTAGAKPEL